MGRTSIRRSARRLLALALSAGLVACGDDSTGPDDGELTESEALVMMEALIEAGGFALSTGFGAGSPPAAPARVVIDESLDEVIDCPGGGAVAVTGSITGELDDEDGTGALEYDITQTHQSCTAAARSDGSVWTFDGDPDVVVDFDVTFGESGFSLSGTQEGAVAWSSGGRDGTCPIDLTYAFSGTIFSFSGSVSGTVCGHDVSDDDVSL